MCRMAASARRSAGRRGVAVPEPSEPDLPDNLTVAGPAETELDDGAVHYGLDVADLDLSDQESVNLEIDQSRYTAVNLSGVRLRRGMIRDAIFERCDLANLRTRDSSMLRTRLLGCRMTGFSFLTGTI